MASSTSNGIITARRHDLDNLRSFLTGLVITHHTSSAYGGHGEPPYKSRLLPPAFHSPPLFITAALDQSFVMGLFFFISGRLSAESLRKLDVNSHGSRGPFLKNRVQRLLLPAVAYTLTMKPLGNALALGDWNYASLTGYLSKYYTSLRSVRGPVWYTATLFVFDMVAMATKPVQNKTGREPVKSTKHQLNPYATWGVWGWVAVAGASFLVRTRYPAMGQKFGPTALDLGFAPQYIFAYVLGHLSVSQGADWMAGPFSSGRARRASEEESSPTSISDDGRAHPQVNSLSFSSATLLSLAALAARYLVYSLPKGNGWFTNIPAMSYGGFNLKTAIFVLWNEFSFAVIGPALMEDFFAYRNKQCSGLFLPRCSYAALLIHMPISVIVQMAVDNGLIWAGCNVSEQTGSVWCTLLSVALSALVGTANSVLSFAIGKKLLETVPILKHII